MDGWAESNNEDAEEITKESRRNRVICVDHCSSNSSILIADGDLLVSQILTRLPVKSLMRFKSVSKGWKSIIEKDEHFINLHHTHSKSRPADFHSGCDGGIINVHSVRRIQSSVNCLGPVRGLLCLVDHFAVRICNVSTGEVTPWIKSNAEKINYSSSILSPDIFFMCISLQYFFGFDPCSGKHKVLCFWWNLETVLTPHCEVLTVGEDNRWRVIDAVPPFRTSSYGNLDVYA
ncbi:Putative F-box protein At1g19160, partial [Linum perenne]